VVSALDWREKMRVAPRLHHSDGMVVAVLGERTIVFPSEADARFFVEAYIDIPNLVGEVASLRTWLDEGALHAAETRARRLEAENVALRARKAVLEGQLGDLAGRAAKSAQRARVLASALKQGKP
jgi:hypothetical protein